MGGEIFKNLQSGAIRYQSITRDASGCILYSQPQKKERTLHKDVEHLESTKSSERSHKNPTIHTIHKTRLVFYDWSTPQGTQREA